MSDWGDDDQEPPREWLVGLVVALVTAWGLWSWWVSR